MPQNLSSARVDRARMHYPVNFEFTQGIPYRQIIATNSQIYRRFIDWLFPQYFAYVVSVDFTRKHCNPPIWTDYHSHDFRLVVELSSPCKKGDLYGVDMIEAEETIRQITGEIPLKINDLEECPNGTTEQLCKYFANKIQFSDRRIKIISISVSETPNRITKLCLNV